MADVVEVVETRAAIEVLQPQVAVVELITRGPQGPPGVPGAAGTVFHQAVPSSTWVIPHSIGRPPVVLLLNTAGRRMFADEYPGIDSVTVIYPFPTAGTAVLI